MLANLCYDLLLGSMACSTLTFATKGGPLIARNMDWFPPSLIAKASAIVPTQNGLSVGFMGAVGVVSGMSNSGFGVILNAASNGQSDINGYPVLLFLRHVLDHANGFDEAFEMISATPLMSGGLITIVGSRNEQRAIVERTPSSAKVRSPRGDEPLIATNHYRLHSAIPECSRYAWLSANANSSKDPMELLTNENVKQTITSQHIIMQPALKKMYLFVPTYLLDPGFKDEAYDLREMLAMDLQQ
jgi:isopenicillin-N N-acyltransferase-like protein